MMSPDPPRILIVDDEEAILETMAFTFMDSYDVHTSTDPQKALGILDDQAPFAVVITDQRMPNMSGVEFLSQVCDRHPETARIMLTGFTDMEATIEAINDGHVYAYVNKPWEPDDLKQVVKRAVDHHRLAAENTRLVAELRSTNSFLEAVMDNLDTGAIAVDAEGTIRAANRPALEYLGLEADPRGERLDAVLASMDAQAIGETVTRLIDEGEGTFQEVELSVPGRLHRLRVNAQRLGDGDGGAIGSVILFREISHEPLRRRFEEIVGGVGESEGDSRVRLEEGLLQLAALAEAVRGSGVASASMAELTERVSRTQTAIQNWLDVDDVLAREDYPDAQLLMDRMRVASERWPSTEELPARVRELTGQVESYYESGENSGKRVL